MSFAHERRSRRMVELEAAELHAARERSERFERRAAASASPRRVRRRGRFWNRTYAPIEVESLPPELEAASLLRGAYDTTPRVPPGLGGERWETWRHVPTVVSPHDDDHDHDDDDAAVPASAPPGLNPHAAPMASVVGKVTAKCYEVDTRDPKRVAQILRENRERIANESGKDGTASDAATDTEADSSESEVELEPSRTIKSRVFHDKTTRVPTQPEGSMRVVATVRDTRGVEMLPPPPPDAHFDAIAKFRRARHDKEAERRRRARERSRERAEAAARRREEKRLAEEEKRVARSAAKDAKAAAKNAAKERTRAAKASSDSESERSSNPEPAKTPRQKLPRMPRGFRRRDDASAGARGAWASACVRSLRHGAVHLRSGAVQTLKHGSNAVQTLPRAAVHSAAVVGKSLHDAGHAMDAAVGSVAKNVVNASVNTWRGVRDSDLAKSAVVATRRFLARRPWEPHLERCSWNVATPPAVSVRVGPARGPGWFRVLKVGPRSFPDLTPPIAPAAVDAHETRHASSSGERERSMAILVKAAGVPVAAKTPADALRMLGMEVRNAGNAVRNSSLRTLEFTLDSAAKTVGAASRTVGGAAEGVGRTLFSAAERLAQRTEFYEELDIDMDDPDAPWPNGCYEDLEGYTHKAEAWAVTPHWSKGMRVPPEESEDDEEEDKFIRSLEPKEARYRDAEDIAAMMLDAGDDYDSYGNDDSYSYRSSRRHSPRQQPKPPRPSFNAPLSPLPPQPTEAEDDEYRHLSPLFVPPEEPRGAEEGAVPLRSLRLDDYEESLATRVRMLQKSFPEVAQEIADAVYDYAGRIGESGAPGERVAASGMSTKPVDVAAATRVVQELEAASMSVLMHGKIPTGETLRAWLDDVVEGRGMGREAWREDNTDFFRGGSHSGSDSKGFSSLDNQETQYSLSPTMEVREVREVRTNGRTDGADVGDAFTPGSKKFVSDIAGALQGWAGREPRSYPERYDGLLARTFDGRDPREEAARVMENEARSRRFIRAWHAACHEGPIANAVRGIEHERFEKSPATAVKGAFAAAERAIERVENVSKFFADTDDSSMDISRDEVAAAGVQSPKDVKSPPRATRKPWDFSDSSQSDIEVDPATPAPAPKPAVEGTAAAVEGGSGRKPGARVIGGLLSPFRTIKNGLKMLSQQNSPEMAVKPTTIAPVSETTSLPVSSAVSESPPASPSVENASEESVNATSASVSVSESASRSPSGSLTGSPSFVAAVEASEEKIVASARDAVTSRFAGKDLEDALVADDDDDSDSEKSPSPAMQSARSKGAQPTMSTGGSSMVTARTGGSVAFSGGPGFSNGGWSATKTIYFDDESPGGTASVSKPTKTAPKTVIKPSSVAVSTKKIYEDESDEDDFEDRFSRFPRAIGDKTMDEMLDALDKDLESSMEESPGPVRFNPFNRFKGFANTKTASVVDASADKENEENSGGNSSGNTTDSDTKEWRRAVDRAKNVQLVQPVQQRVAAFGKVSSPLKPSRVRSPARELAGYGSARAAFEREASRLDASMDRGSRRRR